MYQQKKTLSYANGRPPVAVYLQLPRFLVVCASPRLQKYVVNVVGAVILSLKQEKEKCSAALTET